MRFFGCFVCAFGVFLFVVSPVYAAVTTVQALSFGQFIMKNNDAVYDITLGTNSGVTFSAAGFIQIISPQEGIYDLDGMAPNTAIASVTVTQVTPLSGSGFDMQLINFQETHPASTDGSGVARIEVGATARTNGLGGSYIDQTFNGTIQIQVNF